MRYILINIFVNFFYSIILICIKVNAEHNTIKILMEMPDISKAQYSAQQLSQINYYFSTMNSNSTELKEINIEFSYYDDKKNTNTDYPKYLKYLDYVIEQLESSNPTYDMMILDDRFLFSDISMIENSLIEYFLKSRKFHKKFRDLTDYIKPEDIKHHDEKILNDAYFENHLYGLPYELDFDVLYYSINDTGIISTPSMGNITWDDLLLTESSINASLLPLSVALGNDDEFLNFFIEYFNNYYNVLEETRMSDPDYFNIFYNKTSETVYRSFQKFLDKCSKSNIDQALKTTMEDTFNSFLKKERTFFKGKASYYSFQDDNITFELPPMNYSVINEKYLVLNKKSSIKPEILVKTALQLTSKEMQLFRAEQLGMIPTVDFFKDESDLASYCITHPKVCKIARNIKQIRIKDIFKVNAYSAQFMEIRLSLPMIIDKFLRENDIEYLKRGFRNIIEVKMINYKNTHNPSTIILYIFMVICALGSIIIMIKVFKYRNHPYLKLISPHFSIIIIFGFMLSIFTPLSNIQNNSVQKCKFIYIYENLCDNLILFPMLVVTFRIYCIYTNQSKVNFGKKLSNHRLSIFVFISLLMIVISCTFIVFTKEFFISTSGNIRSHRYPVCNHEGSTLHIILEIIYESSIVGYIYIYIYFFFFLKYKL